MAESAEAIVVLAESDVVVEVDLGSRSKDTFLIALAKATASLFGEEKKARPSTEPDPCIDMTVHL